MNERISATLRERADDEVHIGQLLAAVHAGVRRRRRRRLSAAAAVLAVLGLTATGAVLRPAGAPPDRAVSPAAPQLAVPRPPRVEPAVTAADDPTVLGTDPTRFHLDLTAVTDWTALAWAARPGHEELTLSREQAGEVRIEVDRDPNGLLTRAGPSWDTTVGGRPARAVSTEDSYLVRWQPVPGIWAQVEAMGDDSADPALAVAGQLRLDRVYRCAVPFRLALTGSFRLNKCTTYFARDPGSDGWTEAGGVWFSEGDSEFQVAVGRADPSVVPNDQVDGRPVRSSQVIGNAPAYLELAYPTGDRIVWFWNYTPFNEARLRSLVPAFTPVTDPDHQVWPANPLS
jgi:hypothetical protein